MRLVLDVTQCRVGEVRVDREDRCTSFQLLVPGGVRRRQFRLQESVTCRLIIVSRIPRVSRIHPLRRRRVVVPPLDFWVMCTFRAELGEGVGSRLKRQVLPRRGREGESGSPGNH